MNGPQELTLEVDGRAYPLQVLHRKHEPPDSPRLVIVAYQPNRLAAEILRACIAAVRRYTPEPHELWVIDNHSPVACSDWLRAEPGVNVAFSRAAPLPPEARGFWPRLLAGRRQQKWGSYANALGLELAVRLVDPLTRWFMPLHMDTLPCASHWLAHLCAQLGGEVAAAGVHLQCSRTPEGILHPLGFIVDFQLFRRLGLDFFPALPQYDVADRVTVRLREAGYRVFACPNTFNSPELAERIPSESPLRGLPVLRALDDQGQVIFLHLGRGVRKTTGEHRKGVTAEEWLTFARQYLLLRRCD